MSEHANDGDIPFEVAQKIGEEYDKDQVIILAHDRHTRQTTVTTWGRDMSNKAEAAAGGNKLKRILGWPERCSQNVPNVFVDAARRLVDAFEEYNPSPHQKTSHHRKAMLRELKKIVEAYGR